MNASEGYYVGSPAVDYLTLSTFAREDFRELRALARSVTDGQFGDGRLMQYSGEVAAGYFAGMGDQGGRDHHLVRVSGALAHDMARLTQEARGSFPRTKATRCDVQVTLLSWGIRLADLGLRLERRELGSFRGDRARDRRIKTVRGDDELDTIYIGSRDSERFIRCYVKEIAGARFIRFEVEFKDSLAVQAWAAMLNEGEQGLGGLLRAELDMLPPGLVEALSPVYRAVSNYVPGRLRHLTGAPTWERQLRWLRKQVSPTLEKLLASPARDDVRRLLQDLLANY